MELYYNADLTKVPKVELDFRICTGYLDYGLQVLFSPFVTKILEHFQQVPFPFVLSILEDIK